MNTIVQHPAVRPVPALACVDALDQSAADIRAAASLLHTVARHTRQAITPAWLYHVDRLAREQADDIDYTIDVWHRLPVDPLPAAHRDAIAGHVASIRQHADHVAAIGDAAATCPPSREHVAGALAGLLAAAEALRQATAAAWTACRAPRFQKQNSTRGGR